MIFSKQNLFYIFLVFIFSCSSKQIEVQATQPKIIRPIWLDGLPEDSLFIYGISKLEKNSQLNLDSIVSNQIINVIKESISPKTADNNFSISDSLSVPLREARENFEKEYLTTQIKKFGGNISKTAKFVGMERSALHRKLKLLGVKDLN